jgi:LuxR family maltose regulon positive regulatory protein
LADRLREFGFPETLARFKQFADILKAAEHRSHKTLLVLDDFHLIHSKQALTFAERCAHLKIPGACVIILSRKEPEINAVSLFAKGKACTISEDELRFTSDELEDFLKLRGLPFFKNDLPRLVDATKGWALAIQLFSLVLKRNPQNFNHALDTMKQNVFKLFETEAWNDLPDDIRKILIRSALVADLPLLHDLFNNDSHIQKTSQLSSFIWFDSLSGDYRVHPLYQEFLQSRQDILSENEKQDTYRQAAQWCSENNFYLDTVHYYAKSRQFDLVLDTLFSYPFKLPHDICEYCLTVLEDIIPVDDERSDISYLLLKNLFIPLLLAGAGRYEEAETKSWDTIREWEHSDAEVAASLLGAAYSNLGISVYTPAPFRINMILRNS